MLNGVLLQAFHWDLAADGQLWRKLADGAARIAEAGYTAVWLPPAYKGAGGGLDVGYGVYDLYDLGEFDQKSSVRTKYGTREEFVRAVERLRACGLQVYADLVLNHRQGGDGTEEVLARAVDPNDRTQVAVEARPIRAWTRFTCAGRAGRYSQFEWNAACFSSVDCDANAPDEHAIYLLDGKSFSDEVSNEHGNFDHLLGCDVDFAHEPVRAELARWLEWFVDTSGVDGFRLDALKHIPSTFYAGLLAHIRGARPDREWPAIGEYWAADTAALAGYRAAVSGAVQLFDVPLHYRFVDAARAGRDYDLRTIFDGTYVAADPTAAVTFVDNHDTQPGQSLESTVADWFKPIAYALILLRQDGYPCVFLPDWLGHDHDERPLASHGFLIERMIAARRSHGYGDQHDAAPSATCLAWVRTGDAEHPGSMVVVLSSADADAATLCAYAADAQFVDVTGHIDAVVTTDGEGTGTFPCPAGSLSVWVQR